MGSCGVVEALGSGSGLGFAEGWGRDVAAGLSVCLAVVLGGGRVFGCGVAAGWGFGRAAGAGFAGVGCRPALPVAGHGAAGALAVAGAPAAGTGLRACVDDAARGSGGGFLDDGVVVGAEEVVVVVEVLESEAEETDVGDRGGGAGRVGGGGDRRGGRRGVPDGGGRRWLLIPVGNEGEGAGSGIRRVGVLSLASCVRAGAGAVRGVMCGVWWRRGAVLDARVGELPGVGPLQLQDVWVWLLEALEASEEAPLDAGFVLFCEVVVVLGGGVLAWPQQGHEAGCHHERAELHGDGAPGGWSRAVQGGLPLLGTEGNLPRPALCGDPPGSLCPFGKAVHRPAKALVAAADGEQRV